MDCESRFVKSFDRVNWDALWLPLHDHGISEHLVWILQLIYSNQSGEVQGEHSNSDLFPIHAGVRQGRVLSPRLSCSVLQWGMSAWRRNAETKGCGFDLRDTMPSLLDLRFADDVLLFARTAAEAMALLDDLVRKLQNIGLQLNAAKTVVLTSEVQPPSSLHTNNGTVLRVLEQEEAHKSLGCMISAAGSRNTHLDLQHHLQAASRAFHANKWILCDKNVSILHRLQYFDKVVSPVACFSPNSVVTLGVLTVMVKGRVARSRWRTGGARISSLFSWFRACMFVSSVNFRSFQVARTGAYGFCL